jgi:glutamate-ammonia-ligase adenylyltransferase
MEAVRHRLTLKSEAQKILADAREMRAKVRAQYAGSSLWDLKYAPGGLMDIEFIAQALQLAHAPIHPNVLDTNTIAALERLVAAGCLGREDGAALIQAARLENALTQIVRIALNENLDPATASPGLKALLAEAGGAPDFAGVEDRLRAAEGAAQALFGRLLGPEP